MKHTINLMLAVILLCGLTISSCKKNSNDDTNPTNPAHPTRTMLVGMECSDEYSKTTYTYEYNDNYRIVRSEEYIFDLYSNQGVVWKEYNFSYSEGHISINGFEYGGETISYECTLDDEGRIIHIDKTGIDNYHVDFTYGYNGFLSKRGTNNYIWEAGNLKYIKSQDGEIGAQFEISYASSQAMPSLIGYGDIPELCAQGCFGTLPFNLPSKITYYSSTPGPPFVVNCSYNVDANGHVSSFMKDYKIYTCHWEDI